MTAFAVVSALYSSGESRGCLEGNCTYHSSPGRTLGNLAGPVPIAGRYEARPVRRRRTSVGSPSERSGTLAQASDISPSGAGHSYCEMNHIYTSKCQYGSFML